MTFETLHNDMVAAMKARDKERKNVISTLIADVKKAAIDAGTRDDISEQLVDQVLLKELKATQEQVDTCPASRQDLLAQYKAHLEIVKEYAPQQMGAEEIKALLSEKFADLIATKNKGMIMKTVMVELKGKADGKLISQIVAEFCK